MTQRKPDRAERVVIKAGIFCKAKDGCVECPGTIKKVAKLLRQEHDWMRRMAKEELCVDSVLNSQKVIGWNQALHCILDKLTQRRK